MYKAIYEIEQDCIDETNQEIFAPFIQCYYIHSIIIYFNGIAQTSDTDIQICGHLIKWAPLINPMDFRKDDQFTLDINYFYIRPEDNNILGFLVDSTYSNATKTSEIISKHYVEGQFSLDNGLYKNAVLNFGTTLEGVLNKNLSNTNLDDLITNYNGPANKNFMNELRLLRNKVHPNRISNSQDITRKEAISARNKLELILKKIA